MRPRPACATGQGTAWGAPTCADRRAAAVGAPESPPPGRSESVLVEDSGAAYTSTLDDGGDDVFHGAKGSVVHELVLEVAAGLVEMDGFHPTEERRHVAEE